jgi:hypothetical protein
LQLIIPECGSVYCPWEQFKTIALSRLDLNCVQQPLRSTLAKLFDSTTSEEDDDQRLFASPYEILVITILCLFSTLLAVGLILHLNGYRVGLPHPDSEQSSLIELKGNL